MTRFFAAIALIAVGFVFVAASGLLAGHPLLALAFVGAVSGGLVGGRAGTAALALVFSALTAATALFMAPLLWPHQHPIMDVIEWTPFILGPRSLGSERASLSATFGNP